MGARVGIRAPLARSIVAETRGERHEQQVTEGLGFEVP